MTVDAFQDVLAAAQAGGGWALAVLYRDLQPKLIRYLWARAPGEAEDLASEVWLDVARGLVRFRGDEDGFRAWVFTIARRRLLDLRRRAAVRWRTAVPDELVGGDRPAGDVQDEALASLGTDRALALIAGLPPDQAEVILLRVIADLPVADVARIVGKRPGAVRALQLRGLRGLARIIAPEAVTP
jgi:RNA polymerase sigma-70 factor, ECF subfamily